MKNKITICAVIAVRNETHYLQFLLPYLANQNIDVVIIDNESTDGSDKLYSTFKNSPIVKVAELKYGGVFSLSDQLAAKSKIYSELRYDWLIHHDADEIFQHAAIDLTLRNAIEEADEMGYNTLNFEEFVFLPEPGADYFNRNYLDECHRYYFFEPRTNRKNAAWKNINGLSCAGSGGHRLSGENVLISPTNHIFRHYIVLSETHAKIKYLNRSFDERDRRNGWHGNRLNFTETNLQIPEKSPFIHHLPSPDSKCFCKDRPTNKHFWEW
jgi:glycosyltransferase involved in cell wall biosynthesis